MIISNEIPRVLDIEDRANLSCVSELFLEQLTEMKREGALILVGGVLNKPLPRKDIDLAIVLETDAKDPDMRTFTDYLSYSIWDFNLFKRIVKGIYKRNSNFVIGKETPPFPDRELQFGPLLAHDGSIQLASPLGTPLEFLRCRDRGVAKFVLEVGNDPYKILATR